MGEIGQGGSSNSGDTFYDRGDPAAWDWQVGDFTIDGNWHDLDLSGIVDLESNLVLLAVRLRAPAAQRFVYFRKNGNVNEMNISMVFTQVAGINFQFDALVPCDTNQVIEYKVQNVAWDTINVCVKGWWRE